MLSVSAIGVNADYIPEDDLPPSPDRPVIRPQGIFDEEGEKL